MRRGRSDAAAPALNRGQRGGRGETGAEQPRRAAERVRPFDDLLTLAQRPERGVLVEALSELCLASGRKLSDREHALVFDIFRALLHNVEMRVRQGLAKRLSDRDDAPHDLVLQLANDVIEVAYPIIVKSSVLEEGDLISLILERADPHRVAVAARPEIGEPITDTLVDVGSEPVLRSLVRNASAHIAPETLERLVDSSYEMEAIREPLLNRPDVSPDLAKRMYGWVGEALRQHIAQTYDLNPTLNHAVSQAVADAIKDDVFGDVTAVDLDSFASNPTAFRPSAARLIQALSEGDIFRFEEMFRELTELTSGSVTRVLYDSGAEGLAIACRAIGFDRNEFGEMFCHLHGTRPYDRFRQSKTFQRAVEYFDRMDAAGASRVLKTWRDTPDDSWLG